MQLSISELSVVGGWVVGGGGGGRDKRTSWSDLHRVRQKDLISFQERCVYYLNFKPGYYLYQLIIFGSCWSLHFSAPLRLLGLFVAFAAYWRTRPSPINIFRVCKVVQNGAK